MPEKNNVDAPIEIQMSLIFFFFKAESYFYTIMPG